VEPTQTTGLYSNKMQSREVRLPERVGVISLGSASRLHKDFDQVKAEGRKGSGPKNWTEGGLEAARAERKPSAKEAYEFARYVIVGGEGGPKTAIYRRKDALDLPNE